MLPGPADIDRSSGSNRITAASPGARLMVRSTSCPPTGSSSKGPARGASRCLLPSCLRSAWRSGITGGGHPTASSPLLASKVKCTSAPRQRCLSRHTPVACPSSCRSSFLGRACACGGPQGDAVASMGVLSATRVYLVLLAAPATPGRSMPSQSRRASRPSRGGRCCGGRMCVMGRMRHCRPTRCRPPAHCKAAASRPAARRSMTMGT